MNKLFFIFVGLFLVPMVSAVTDYNFYRCSDNFSFGTSFNYTLYAGVSDTSICVNTSGICASSSSFSVLMSGIPGGIETLNPDVRMEMNESNLAGAWYANQSSATYNYTNYPHPLTNYTPLRINMFLQGGGSVNFRADSWISNTYLPFGSDNWTFCGNGTVGNILGGFDSVSNCPFSWDGPELWVKIQTTSFGPGSASTHHLDVQTRNLTNSTGPINITLDINADGTNEYTSPASTPLNTTISQVARWTEPMPSGIFTAGGMKILNFTAEGAGNLELSDINFGACSCEDITPQNNITALNWWELNATTSDPDGDELSIYHFNKQNLVKQTDTENLNFFGGISPPSLIGGVALRESAVCLSLSNLNFLNVLGYYLPLKTHQPPRTSLIHNLERRFK